MWLLPLPLLAIVTIAVAADDPFVVLRCRPGTQGQLAFLQQLCEDERALEAECWTRAAEVGKDVDVFLGPSRRRQIQGSIAQLNMTCNIVVPDVYESIRSEHRHISKSRLRKKRENAEFEFGQYHSFAEIQNFLYDVAYQYPNIASVQTIGYSTEGRPLLVLKISGRSNATRDIWIDGGMHAREWPAPHAALFLVHKLTSEYGRSADVRHLVDNIAWYILPVANPDGYVFSQSIDPEENKDDISLIIGTRLWRKNRRASHCASGDCCMGVDLNRNFDFRWDAFLRSGPEICHPNSAGPRPFSEPETQAIRDFITRRLSTLKAYVSLHTYGQIWIHPFGHEEGSYPEDIDQLLEVGTAAVRGIRSATGAEYELGSTADKMYRTSGTSLDWAKAAGVKFAFLVELRPQRRDSSNVVDQSGGFFLPPARLRPTAHDAFAGIRQVALAAIRL